MIRGANTFIQLLVLALVLTLLYMGLDAPLLVARNEFDRAGLHVSDMVVTSPMSRVTNCDGNLGLYYEVGRVGIIELCSDRVDVQIHEMAHAYTYLTLTQEDRDAWAEFKGVPWYGDDYQTSSNETAARAVAWWVEYRCYTPGLEILVPDAKPGACMLENI